ncbi:hypothetical protein ABT288_10635 [Streptomyces sp. NPDC001093]|uniref:vWA-MoxR associated conflict system protein n=1 Tax=Streptomyces sp. NPDC001093 TaxID=3154376 RepID=UPI00332296DB
MEQAIRDAAEVGAVLVLGFLGHGQSPKASPRLHYMASDSKPGELLGSIDIGALLIRAADHPGIGGVIGLVDTCHAGAAVPESSDLKGGFSMGATRLSVLMASAAHQKAYDLDFSRTLTRLIRQGLPGRGPTLRAATLKLALGESLLRQNTSVLDLDGSPDATEELWITVNARRPDRPGGRAGRTGPLGEHDLSEALAAELPGHPHPPGGWTRTALEELHDTAAGPVGALWVEDVAGALIRAADTVTAVEDWAEGELTLTGLRKALRELSRLRPPGAGPEDEGSAPPDGLSTSELLRYLVEYAVLRLTRVGSGANPLARAVAAVGIHCGLDTSDPKIQAWARRTGCAAELRQAHEAYDRTSRDRALRLVVSLQAAQVDWPDSLLAWLLDGADCLERTEWACDPTRAGVEQRLAEIVLWADARVAERAPVRHIDIAAPAPLLATWQPETVRVGPYRLGARRTVVLRWARRLAVPSHLTGMNEFARRQLEELDETFNGPGAPIDWLGATATQVLDALRERLSTGIYRRAIGLDHRPSHLGEVLEAVLPYSPIVLWPRGEQGIADDERRCLDEHWDRLPDRFTEAYAHHWQQEYADAVADPLLDRLARLSAAWHDPGWLDFCQRTSQHHQQHTPTTPWSA